MNINPSLTRDLAPVIDDVGAPKLPWVPMHPAMIPLSETAIERGLSRIKALRDKYLTPKPRKAYNKVSITDNCLTLDERRKSSQVTADITALSSLDNKKLGLYQHA